MFSVLAVCLLLPVNVFSSAISKLSWSGDLDADEASLIQVSGVVYERLQPVQEQKKASLVEPNHSGGAAFDLARNMWAHSSEASSSTRLDQFGGISLLMQSITRSQRKLLNAVLVVICLGLIPVLLLFCVGVTSSRGAASSDALESNQPRNRLQPHQRHNRPGSTTAPKGLPSSPPTGSLHADPRPNTKEKLYLAVPFLLDAPTGEMAKKDYQVADKHGKTLLHVSLMAPPKELSESAPAPQEYLTLFSLNGEDELAMCALGPQAGTNAWRCDVYQKGDTLFGHIVHSRSAADAEEFDVVDAQKNPILRIIVQVRDGRTSRVTVYMQSHNECADAVPKDSRFATDAKYYQVECLPDADLGIIVISIMGADRLLTHMRSVRRSAAF